VSVVLREVGLVEKALIGAGLQCTRWWGLEVMFLKWQNAVNGLFRF